MDVCDENRAWTNGWRRLRAQRRRFPRSCYNGLHASGDSLAKQIEPEPTPKGLVEWAMTEKSDDEDDSTPAKADAEVSDDSICTSYVQLRVV